MGRPKVVPACIRLPFCDIVPTPQHLGTKHPWSLRHIHRPRPDHRPHPGCSLGGDVQPSSIGRMSLAIPRAFLAERVQLRGKGLEAIRWSDQPETSRCQPCQPCASSLFRNTRDGGMKPPIGGKTWSEDKRTARTGSSRISRGPIDDPRSAYHST